MGLSNSINNAISGLRLTQSAMEVVSGNVANADSIGYSRRTIISVENVGADSAGYGVRSEGVTRILDTILQRELRAETAGQGLHACNPIKLGLALNFSVFHYEVMQDNKQACQLAETALQDAMNKIDDVDEETFRDAKSIIELLKENLTLWKEEEGNADNNIEDL
jgi:hypothetical protein